MVYKWLNITLFKVAGRRCFLCGQSFRPHLSNHFCHDCLNDLPYINPACSQCGTSLNIGFGQDEHSQCGPCLTKPPSYDRVISAFAYANPIRQLISQFKYQRQLAIGMMLAEILESKVLYSSPSVEAILPVPLHPSRLRQRGFNQALELARPLAKTLERPLLMSQVHRQKNTLEQSSLSGKQRRSNLKQAFSVSGPIPYTSVAIVDDVMTTGSTVGELSALLKRNGVRYIEIWCAARATIN